MFVETFVLQNALGNFLFNQNIDTSQKFERYRYLIIYILAYTNTHIL